jgi:hypothetical protein
MALAWFIIGALCGAFAVVVLVLAVEDARLRDGREA